jgi:hypothetical protein
MSSIFSDPFFRRGGTLLGGEEIEKDSAGNPIAGREVVGQVKAFQDVNPQSRGERYSNRLVYCVAARYLGSDTTGSALKGQLVAFDGATPLTTVTSAATKTNVSDGRSYGVVDEYLPDGIPVRQNDIVWIVVKGPTTVLKENGASGFGITAGNAVVVSNTAGSVTPSGATSAGTVQIGDNLGGTVATTATTVRVNLWSTRI